jgi:hypothetical protein
MGQGDRQSKQLRPKNAPRALHLIEEALIEVVCPQPLLRGHPRIVPSVEWQLQHGIVDVNVEQVVVLLTRERALAQRTASRRARHLADLLPCARRDGPLVQDGRSLVVFDNLVLSLARARLCERLL